VVRQVEALADAALRAGRVTPAELAAAVARHGWPRSAAATDLLTLLDGRRDSVLESQSAVVMHQHGLQKPAEQVRIVDDRDRFVGRVDFLWLDHGVVGEADGLVKYSGEDSSRVVAAERAREARLRALGLVVVRWTAAMLYGDPPPFSCSSCAPPSPPAMVAASAAASPDCGRLAAGAPPEPATYALGPTSPASRRVGSAPRVSVRGVRDVWVRGVTVVGAGNGPVVSRGKSRWGLQARRRSP
jgi:hypothetical protein